MAPRLLNGKKVKKDPLKPRGPVNSYALFVKFYTQKRKSMFPGQKLSFFELCQQCSQVWKKLSPEQRQFFRNESAKDRERYRSEMEGYTPPVPGMKLKKKKKAKDPNRPLKPLSAFFWFSSEYRPKVKESFPNYSLPDLSKELGRIWAGLDPELKNLYKTMYERDRERFLQEKRLYMEQKETMKMQGNPDPGA